MSFKENSCQQISIVDSFFNLTSREQKSLEKSWAKIFADEIFPFRLRYSGKENVKTKFGSINCIKISPVVEVGRMFKKDDDLTIWFTDDDNRLPVMVRMDIRIVGAVFLKLIGYENTASPIVFQ